MTEIIEVAVALLAIWLLFKLLTGCLKWSLIIALVGFIVYTVCRWLRIM